MVSERAGAESSRLIVLHRLEFPLSAMSEVDWEEGQYLETSEEMENDCLKMGALLTEVASCDFSKHYHKDIPRFVEAIKILEERCRREREAIGLWREDQLEPDEILDALDAEFGSLVERISAKIYPGRKWL